MGNLTPLSEMRERALQERQLYIDALGEDAPFIQSLPWKKDLHTCILANVDQDTVDLVWQILEEAGFTHFVSDETTIRNALNHNKLEGYEGPVLVLRTPPPVTQQSTQVAAINELIWQKNKPLLRNHADTLVDNLGPAAAKISQLNWEHQAYFFTVDVPQNGTNASHVAHTLKQAGFRGIQQNGDHLMVHGKDLLAIAKLLNHDRYQQLCT